MNRFFVIAALAASALGTVIANADGATAVPQARVARFAAFHAAHADPEAEIAALKAQTAALMHATPSLPVASAAAPAPDSDAALDRAPTIWRVAGQPVELWDGADYPRMIAIPAGEYTMGSPGSEPGHQPGEGPRHRVRIGYNLAVSQFPVTVAEYARFVAATHHDVGEACFTMEHADYRLRGNRDFRRVGFRQGSNSPAVCINWYDAMAYVEWLSRTTGHSYRLLSEAEFEYVDRAGTTTAYWWGDQAGVNHANCDGCGSRFDNATLATVGSFAANGFDLYDTNGNTLTWLADCWNANYVGAPADGSAFATGDCDLHVLRGGSLHSPPKALRAAARSRHWFSLRNITVGLRVARDL